MQIPPINLSALQPNLVAWRRYFHQHPEPSSQEHQTLRYIMNVLRPLGFSLHPVQTAQDESSACQGLIACWDTKKEGPTIALRADIDALPMQESPQNEKQKKVACSLFSHAAHTCGHDAHMAMLLGVAQWIATDYQGNGRILLLFESAEETGEGIFPMLKALERWKPIQAIYGAHISSALDTGVLSIEPGPRMAGQVQIDFSVCGKGGHGSRPDRSINPIFASAQVLSALPSAWTNRLDPTQMVTLGIAMIHGGDAPNIFPDKVRIQGTLRYYEEQAIQHAMKELRHVIESTAAAHRCHVEYNNNKMWNPDGCPKIWVPPVHNDPALSASFAHFVDEHLLSIDPSGQTCRSPVPYTWGASESFSRYQSIAPSCFVFVGARNEAQGMSAEHHNAQFDIDEAALSSGTLAGILFILHQMHS